MKTLVTILLLAIVAMAFAQDYAAWSKQAQEQCSADFAKLCSKAQKNLKFKQSLVNKAKEAVSAASAKVAQLKALLKINTENLNQVEASYKASTAAATEAGLFETHACAKFQN